MLGLIGALLVAYIVYKLLTRQSTGTTTENKETEVGILRDTAKQFKADLTPAKEAVTSAVTNARTNYNEAQRQAELQKLLERLQQEPGLIAQMAETVARQQLEATTPPPPPQV